MCIRDRASVAKGSKLTIKKSDSVATETETKPRYTSVIISGTNLSPRISYASSYTTLSSNSGSTLNTVAAAAVHVSSSETLTAKSSISSTQSAINIVTSVHEGGAFKLRSSIPLWLFSFFYLFF